MRLLHLMNYQPLGTRAMDHFILEYARQATARGWEVAFGFTGEPPQEFQHLNWKVYRRLHPDECGYCLCGMCDNAPDVIQTSFHSVFEEGILKLNRVWDNCLIVIDHASGAGPSPRSWLTPLRRWRGRRVGKVVEAIVCVSEYNARRAIERVFLPAAKVHVVPNGIDLARFPFSPRTNQQPLKVLYIGQLIPEKGVLTLLEAVRQIDESFELLIAGSGPQRSELESFVQRHAMTNVRFLGHVADVAGLYSSVDIVAIPSEWAEAFGLVAIEAMACGAAVIASDAGALPEVIGDAGVIFAKGNAADLAAKLRMLLQDHQKRAELAKLARARVEENYQLGDCVRKHLDIVASTFLKNS